jgi:GNAT superfamily N-acetyltransferase
MMAHGPSGVLRLIQLWLSEPKPLRELETTVTYLEMASEHVHRVAPPSNLKLMLLRAESITTDFYRFLYSSVGKGFEWHDRRYLSDEELSSAIHRIGVEVWVVYVNGQPAGFFELAPENGNMIELEYFGLISEFRGKGLGKWLLAEAIRAGWAGQPKKLIVQTCTLDGPAALPLYQKMGFAPYDQKNEIIIARD